ncbi:alpha/beta hydrolase [Amantichitinum ursilacus]|uniref:Carboxylesterase 2 n=1 Tax=Amantichitinum ursilacus TaxID=857265 RepID=A0A0N0XIR6_9NEIS|nr:alpha/beta fold hydrolase [Amantichitinum ursilacus]KPC52990.1 Carboxylesterase 2 [Amantichitinum ursilacus]
MSDTPLLDAIEIDTGANPTAAVIWMHGLGADGSDFAGVLPQLGLPPELAVRFVFPHAPHMPITCNNGYVMRAWYDILYFDDIDRHADENGVRQSIAAVAAMIAQLNRDGIATKRIVLAGFSQGGAIAYSAGLTYPDKLAGIVALSTYWPSASLINNSANNINRGTPVFAAHGLQDPVVPYVLGDRARAQTEALGNPVQWQHYPMQHSVCVPELQAIGAFLRKVLA